MTFFTYDLVNAFLKHIKVTCLMDIWPSVVRTLILATWNCGSRSTLHLALQPQLWLLTQKSENSLAILPAAGPFLVWHFELPGASHTLACAHMLVYDGVRLSTKDSDCNSVSLCVSPSFFPLRVLWREAAISHVCVSLTMLLLVVLGTVFSFTVVTTERAENTSDKTPAPALNYSRISLPPEHVPYFLNNNKKVAKKCRSDPLCPFKVSYASWQLLRLFSLHCGSMLAALRESFSEFWF